MNKFYAVIVGLNFEIKRVWMTNENILSLLKEKKVGAVFKNDQQAMLIEDKLYWQDVKHEDFESKDN